MSVTREELRRYLDEDGYLIEDLCKMKGERIGILDTINLIRGLREQVLKNPDKVIEILDAELNRLEERFMGPLHEGPDDLQEENDD